MRFGVWTVTDLVDILILQACSGRMFSRNDDRCADARKHVSTITRAFTRRHRPNLLMLKSSNS